MRADSSGWTYDNKREQLLKAATPTINSRWRIEQPGMIDNRGAYYPAGTVLEVITVGDTHAIVKVVLIVADTCCQRGSETYSLGLAGAALPVHRNLFAQKLPAVLKMI